MENEIDVYFYKLYYENLGISDFEQWVYRSTELKERLNPDDYLALISLNYKSKHAKNEIEKIISPYFDYGKFETQNLLTLLHNAMNNIKYTGEILRTFYDLYCHGYNFLQDLGLGYGLTCEVPPNKYKAQSWEELSEIEKKEIINSFYPQLTHDLHRAIDWLENKRIVLSGRKNDMGDWIFHDYRNEAEKKSTIWVEVRRNPETGESISKNLLWEKPNKKWWEVWKK